MATPYHPSAFERTLGRSVNPLWILRAFALTAIVILVLAMFVCKSGNHHDFCLGLAVGVLIGLVAQLFATTSIELKSDPQRSDVENVSVTR